MVPATLLDRVSSMNSESIRNFGYGVAGVLVILVIPFSVGLCLLLVVGVAWWIAAPIALIAMPFVRSFLFGPPCVCVHRSHATQERK